MTADRRCGIEELHKFQQVLLPTYQLKVLQIGRPHMIIFAGAESPHLIRLILEDGHYDGCTSFKAILGRNFFCNRCDRGFDHDTFAEHPCDGRRCPACHDTECVDFRRAREGFEGRRHASPSVPCNLCHRKFFGDVCMARHISNPLGGKTMCDRMKKCPACCKVFGVEYGAKGNRKGKQHRCGYAECVHCEKEVETSSHCCFIQRVKKADDDPKTKWVPLNRVGSRATIGEAKKGKILVEREPPLFVYANYEAMTNAEGYQEAVLIGFETSESDECVMIRGRDCTGVFIRELEGLAVDQDGDDRNVISIFHNLKGYDGMFLLEYLYKEKRAVDRMVNVGAKVLSFTSDRLCFKDSVCFLPFPLAPFSATFGLTELHKCFFPHAF